MPGRKGMEKRREQAYTLYRKGMSFDDIADLCGVAKRTVERWVKKFGWKTEANEVRTLEQDIEKAMQEALLEGLKNYKDNPNNSSLQSLVALIKDYIQKNKPSKDLNDHIVKFLEQTVDFYIEKGYEQLCNMFQESLLELSEHLRISNNG